MKIKHLCYSVTLILGMLFLTGCSDMVEIQNRDFVLALGISYTDGVYEFTYALPDLSLAGDGADSGANLVRSYSGRTFPEIEDTYNRNSDKRLDYRHLQVIVLDPSISEEEEKLDALIRFINDNNEISRNVLVYYCNEDLTKLFELDEELNGSIGDYIKKVDENNTKKLSITPVSTGNFIDSLYSDMTLILPILEYEDSGIQLNGAAVFHNNLYYDTISEEAHNLYYIAQGEGSDYILNLSEHISIKINDLGMKKTYLFADGIPQIELNLSGSAEILTNDNDETEAYIQQSLNDYLKTQIAEELEQRNKKDHIDYLNLYAESGIKNRSIWLKYQDKEREFLDDVLVHVKSDFRIQ